MSKSRSFNKIFDVVTVGERGQVVIPVAARRAFGIRAGDKVVAFRGPMGKVLAMAKIDDMTKLLGNLIDGFGKIKEKIG